MPSIKPPEVLATRGIYISIHHNSQLSQAFMQWQIDNEIFCILGTAWSGMGSYGGMFRRQDEPKIIEFFANHNWDMTEDV